MGIWLIGVYGFCMREFCNIKTAYIYLLIINIKAPAIENFAIFKMKFPENLNNSTTII